jgi:hypothetical protein
MAIKLNPRWKFDYARQVQSYLATTAAPPGARNLSESGGTMRVDFLVAGAQRSGTRALRAYLQQQPEVCMAARKELHFFDNERIFNAETVDFSSPEKFFSGKQRLTRRKIFFRPGKFFRRQVRPVPCFLRAAAATAAVWRGHAGIYVLVRCPQKDLGI